MNNTSKTISFSNLQIRTILVPGDLGFITHMHGDIYHRENGFGLEFEKYVMKGLAEFYDQYNPELDRVWLAENDSGIVASLVLMHRPQHAAQLRYFLIDPDFRNIGLGRFLMQEFMKALIQLRYQKCYLWSTDEQPLATSIYEKNGFRFVTKKESTEFGKKLVETYYEWFPPND